ncbi:MAG: hypothetical protein WBC70_08580 [Candidatus Aminicenantales bacterium]
MGLSIILIFFNKIGFSTLCGYPPPAVKIPKIASFDADSSGNIYIWSDLNLSERDEIIISAIGGNELMIMSTVGIAIKEARLPSLAARTIPIILPPIGKVLARRWVSKPEEEIDEAQVVLCDKEVNELSILGPIKKTLAGRVYRKKEQSSRTISNPPPGRSI